MNIAIYRIHYGLDFIGKSIKSIIDDIDLIFIFYSNNPWIVQKKMIYKNQEIDFPNNPENVEKYLFDNFGNNSKIKIINFECHTPLNQFGIMYEIALENIKKKPKKVLFIEPDMVFPKNGLKNLIYELNLKFWLQNISTKEIELWKLYDYKKKDCFRVPYRKRSGGGAILWRSNYKIKTGFSPKDYKKKIHFSWFVETLNLGFCVNDKTMLYKFLIGLVYTKKIGDSIMNEDWYEKKWINWNIGTKNLEQSKGAEHRIPYIIKYQIPSKFYKNLN